MSIGTSFKTIDASAFFTALMMRDLRRGILNMRSKFHGVATLFHVGGFDDGLCICPHIRVAEIECDAERAASDDRFPGGLECVA
jgi:hypothetical protein